MRPLLLPVSSHALAELVPCVPYVPLGLFPRVLVRWPPLPGPRSLERCDLTYASSQPHHQQRHLVLPKLRGQSHLLCPTVSKLRGEPQHLTKQLDQHGRRGGRPTADRESLRRRHQKRPDRGLPMPPMPQLLVLNACIFYICMLQRQHHALVGVPA